MSELADDNPLGLYGITVHLSISRAPRVFQFSGALAGGCRRYPFAHRETTMVEVIG